MNCMAHGGEVEPDGDGELMDTCAQELCEAFEKKDKKGILDELRAIVLSCGE
jgi:hypothetical protein